MTGRRLIRGDSLVEVLIALSLVAVTALGIIAAQTWLARNERALLARERASSIADSIAEGIQDNADHDPAMAQWRQRAATLLPAGDIAVLDRGDGVHVVVVKWRSSDEHGCADPDVGAKWACVSVAFAR